MNTILYILLWIWQLPQNLAGFVFSLFSVKKEKFHTSTIYYLPWDVRFGVSLGNYIILSTAGFDHDLEFVKGHEYGHSIQSRYLGPLYLIIVGIPSVTLNRMSAYFYDSRDWDIIKVNDWYYSKFPEKWANDLYDNFVENDK